MKKELSPLSIVFDSRADTIKVAIIPTKVMMASIAAATREDVAGYNPAKKIVAISIMVGHRPLQGTKLLVRMAISRSRGELMLLQEIMRARIA